jgi:hypothetical protein
MLFKLPCYSPNPLRIIKMPFEELSKKGCAEGPLPDASFSNTLLFLGRG